MTQQLVKAIGAEVTVEVIVGWHNLDEVQLEMAEEQSWVEAEAFSCPREEAFFEFNKCLWSTEMDLQPSNLYSFVFGTGFDYQFRHGTKLYGLKFKRGADHLPFAAVIQEFEKVDFLLPEDPTDEQAMQMIDVLSRNVYGGEFDPEPVQVSQVIKDLIGYSNLSGDDFEDPTDEQAVQMIDVLSRNVYGGEFNPEPVRVSQVIKDLVRYSDMGDEDFDELRNEPMKETLTALFDECRVTSDIVGLMSEFFDTHLGRTL